MQHSLLSATVPHVSPNLFPFILNRSLSSCYPHALPWGNNFHSFWIFWRVVSDRYWLFVSKQKGTWRVAIGIEVHFEFNFLQVLHEIHVRRWLEWDDRMRCAANVVQSISLAEPKVICVSWRKNLIGPLYMHVGLPFSNNFKTLTVVFESDGWNEMR